MRDTSLRGRKVKKAVRNRKQSVWRPGGAGDERARGGQGTDWGRIILTDTAWATHCCDHNTRFPVVSYQAMLHDYWLYGVDGIGDGELATWETWKGTGE